MINISAIYSSIQTLIKANNLDLTTQIGSVVSDVFITPLAQKVLEELIQEGYTKAGSSLDRLIALKTDPDFLAQINEINLTSQQLNAEIYAILNKIASNYKLVRIAAVNTTGLVYFCTASIPSVDIIIPTNSRISTVLGKDYVTTETKTIVITNINDYYDPDLNAYVIAVLIQAVTAGSIGNTGIETITVMDDVVANVEFIINKSSLVNGDDEETDEEFVARIKTKLAGNNLGTPSGYQSTALNEDYVQDCIVVKPNDPEMKRNSYGGSIDIMIVGEHYDTQTDVLIYQAALHSVKITLANRPAEDIDSVVSNAPHTFIKGTDYNFTKDTNLLAGSIQSSDCLTWLGATMPAEGETLTIIYQRNKLVQDLQDIINLDENKIIAADILVREATKVLIDIIFDLHIYSGYDFTTISATITTNLTTYINAFKLDEDVQISDLIAEIYKVAGVDNVTNMTINTVVGDLNIDRTQYARSNSITINQV